jgi:hypothetical protein
MGVDDLFLTEIDLSSYRKRFKTHYRPLVAGKKQRQQASIPTKKIDVFHPAVVLKIIGPQLQENHQRYAFSSVEVKHAHLFEQSN